MIAVEKFTGQVDRSHFEVVRVQTGRDGDVGQVRGHRGVQAHCAVNAGVVQRLAEPGCGTSPAVDVEREWPQSV